HGPPCGMQRLDTSHGLDGGGPEPVANGSFSQLQLRPRKGLQSPEVVPYFFTLLNSTSRRPSPFSDLNSPGRAPSLPTQKVSVSPSSLMIPLPGWSLIFPLPGSSTSATASNHAGFFVRSIL